MRKEALFCARRCVSWLGWSMVDGMLNVTVAGVDGMLDVTVAGMILLDVLPR